jgi:DNA invertase Pin-like site-specific DNA recombinase/DNA-binding transcriptional MerR regulator
VSTDTAGKVDAARLARDAYLYIRQSSLAQVTHNTESTLRQYDLRGRATALGWPAERIHVIDVDQGHSGASAADREGFKHLVAEVSLGRAGIVLGLECSRLARNNADWHRLLEICAYNDTLICDEDGLYDPTTFNDRLVLGMKGQISEAELHFLRARMQGGLLAKARRGELRTRLPIGLVHDHADNVTLDPDAGVRGAVALLLDTFTATGSARAVVKAFTAAGLRFPGRHLVGPHAGELYWKPMDHSEVLAVLHNPAYAGAYVYGRRKHTVDLDGHHHSRTKPQAERTVLITEHHPGYLTWAQFEHNQGVLAANAAARGDQRTKGPAREGPALLQGLAICGRCGRRMSVGYHRRAALNVPDYHCQRESIANAVAACQAINGAGIDAVVADLVLAALTPLALEVALSVSDELVHHHEHNDALRAGHVQRAEHTADQARRRYLAVDPSNRMVADTLEADWNNALRELTAIRDDYQRAHTDTGNILDNQQRQRIRALAEDFPTIWNDPATPIRERKRLIRLLVTDVTLTRHPQSITAHVRLTGGQNHTLTIDRPHTAAEQHTTDPATIELIDELLDDHPNDEIVAILHQRGITGGWGKAFNTPSLTTLTHAYALTSHGDRLIASGMLTTNQIATELAVTTTTIRKWYRRGQLTGLRVNGRRECVYHPGQHRPEPDQMAAARRPKEIANLITSTQLAVRLAVTSETILRWHQLGLITPATRHRGRDLYYPDQSRPSPAEITATRRPPGTLKAITGGQLAAKLNVTRSTIYKWYRLGLIDDVGTDTTSRHLYDPDQPRPTPYQITAARARARTATT